jgi:thiol-disulfide isomerase/thioredoxin
MEASQPSQESAMHHAIRSLAAAFAIAAAGMQASAAPAPDFVGIANWINSSPLSMQQLRGKVVLVDFWTYDCINCLHVLPYVKGWHQKYKDQGLVVVGVHTPEYGFERNLDNLKTAVQRNGITFPVAQDNRYETWTAYNNQFWPAFYLVDRKGEVVYTHFGEGDYAQTEATIRKLLAQQ